MVNECVEKSSFEGAISNGATFSGSNMKNIQNHITEIKEIEKLAKGV